METPVYPICHVIQINVCNHHSNLMTYSAYPNLLKMQFLKIKESNTRQSNAFHQPWNPVKAASPTKLDTIWLVLSLRRQRRNITKFSWNHKPNKSQNYRNSHFTNTPNSNLPQKTWWTMQIYIPSTRSCWATICDLLKDSPFHLHYRYHTVARVASNYMRTFRIDSKYPSNIFEKNQKPQTTNP
jgi:hypothetical protein